MHLAIGTTLSFEDEGEGWFPLAAASALRGSVVGIVAQEFGAEPFYIVQLDSPLEVQESTGDTPSRLGQRFYDHLIIRSRWVGITLGSAPRVSVYVALVPEGSALPSTREECAALPLRIWASCGVVPTYA
jgi:hypothetical protein